MNTKNITITTESGATFDFTVKVLRYWTEEETVKREWGGNFTFTRAKFDLEIAVPDGHGIPHYLPPFKTPYSMGAGCMPDTPFVGSEMQTGLKLSPRSEDMARKTGNHDYWRRCFDAVVQKYNPGKSVIAALCVDAQSVQNGETFIQWCEDMGEDSISVREIHNRMMAYDACQRTYQWLKAACGTDERLQSLIDWANEQ